MKFTVRQARRFADLSEIEMSKKLMVCRETYRKLEEKPELITKVQRDTVSLVTGIPLNQIIFK